MVGFVDPNLMVLRSYQGAEANRLTNHKKPKNQSANQELRGPYGADAARAWARSFVRDNAYAFSAADTIVSNVIGSGIKPLSVHETDAGDDVPDVNEQRDALWEEWCEVCDINGELSFYELQALVMREMVEAGEVLIRFIRTPGKEYRGISRPVPLALELIEADRLASDKDTFVTRQVNTGSTYVERGVAMDDKGKPIGYWIYPAHPNSPVPIIRTPEFVKASDIRHIYRKDRVGQSRGITWFAPVMSWLRDLGVYVDNEIQASAVASCFGVVIKGDGPTKSLNAPDGEDTTDDQGNTLEYLEPGIVTRIGGNQDISVIDPGRPNSASEPWINLMLRGIAAGLGISYESVSKDFSKTSYSSSRTSKLEDRPRYKRWQRLILNDLCQPVWDEFYTAAALVGADGFPTATELLDSRRKAAPVEWQTPEWEWPDPMSEQSAAKEAVESLMSTRQDEMGSRGKNWRTVFWQLKKENDLRKKLGLLTPEEQTAQMMASQAGGGSSSPVGSGQPPPTGTGEMMGLSTLQYNRNRKVIDKTLDELASGEITALKASALLSSVGLSETTIQALITDAADGTIDTPMPSEEAPADAAV